MPSVVLNLHQVGLLLDEVMQDRLRDLDLTTLQGHVLVLAASRLAGITSYEIRTSLAVSSSRMTTIVSKLERLGLVQRLADEDDRRFVLVVPTLVGREAARMIREAAEDLEEHLGTTDPGDVLPDALTVAALITRSPWVGPNRVRVRMVDWA